jgi:hypothetical protein
MTTKVNQRVSKEVFDAYEQAGNEAFDAHKQAYLEAFKAFEYARILFEGELKPLGFSEKDFKWHRDNPGKPIYEP